jgi:rubrerythrin
MNEQTRANLLTAMQGEAFAYAKYLLFAEQARQSGHAEVAALFARTAAVERLEHFAEEAELAGFGGSEAENLRQAMSGEAYEDDTMYREFAEQAEAAGEPAAAERFREIQSDEAGHLAAFQAVLAKIEVP